MHPFLDRIMLRVLSKRFAAFTVGRESWVLAASRRGRNDVAVPPPTPPANLPAELFEWEYLVKHAETDEEKKEVLTLKALYTEAELLNKKDFKMTVDWEEFEGKVPDVILQKYKDIHGEAVRDFKAGKFDIPFDQAEWDKKTGEIMTVVQKMVENAKTRVAELEEEIQKTEGRLARLETATIDEEMALDPELAKEVDDAVSEELGYTR